MKVHSLTPGSLVPSLLERSGLTPSDVPSVRWISVGGPYNLAPLSMSLIKCSRAVLGR
jgi:hypothetical protein